MTYSQKLKDPRWQKRRLHILGKRDWKCERCQDEKTTLHVHHKKYRGQPWDALDRDLEVLCEPCHSGTHSKNISPVKTPFVYCGGKIGINDWRHRLFDLSLGQGYASVFDYPEANVRAHYCGPFFENGDHGYCHKEKSHGQFTVEWLKKCDHVYAGDFEDLDLRSRMDCRIKVYKKCMAWMEQASGFFFYIDGDAAYGTIVELFHAAVLYKSKPISLFFASEALLEEYWFLVAHGWRNTSMPAPQDLVEHDVVIAFKRFLSEF